MFENEQLKIILKSLEYSINGLENYLEKYADYLSVNEKKEMFKELQNYKNIQMKTEWIIGNKEAKKILVENV